MKSKFEIPQNLRSEFDPLRNVKFGPIGNPESEYYPPEIFPSSAFDPFPFIPDSEFEESQIFESDFDPWKITDQTLDFDTSQILNIDFDPSKILSLDFDPWTITDQKLDGVRKHFKKWKRFIGRLLDNKLDY